jgi:putative DNA primase/helicase
VLDLRTEELQDGRPEDYIFRSSPVNWEGLHAPAPIWEVFLNETYQEMEEIISFVQRAFGYAITGLNREHIFLVLYGQGRNGKGTFVETISDVLGTMASPIQSELLLDQGFSKTAASPSPEIMTLKGLRLAFASETDEGRKFSSSRVKWLTGGESLTGRYPYDKYPITFKPTHTLVLMTNNKPKAPPDDFAFWERIFLIPFPLSFVDREPIAPNERRARKGLVEDLKKEAPGILAWLVRGCLEYQKRGLDPPQCILDEKKAYRREQDILADFIEEFCELEEFARTRATVLYDKFSDWFEEFVSTRGMKQKRFGTLMARRFDRVKIGGIVYYVGIKLKDKKDEGPSGK